MSGLAFENVACARGGRTLFGGVSFTLGPGDALLVSGPNGAGKSSLVRVAAGLLAPAGGRVSRDGRTALLAEATALDPEVRLGEAHGFWAALDGSVPVLDAVGLGHLADVPVRLLSTGQRRRAGMARVVGSNAAIWLLDEPANGLDTAAVGMLERLIAEHRVRGGIALVATHLPLALPDAQTLVLG